MSTPLPYVVRALAEEALLLARSLGEAEAVQWSSAPIPKPREDTTERASGGHGDPTFDTVADERRLAVRAAVLTAGNDLEAAVLKLRTSRELLDVSLARWAGESGSAA